MGAIDEAFEVIKRRDFVPLEYRDVSDADVPLPIGYGQTISQPSTVRAMLTWLDPQLGDRALDVGSGSGWTTALLAQVVGSRGFVYAVELIPELVTVGCNNCERAGIENALFFQASDLVGLPEYAPYDRILVSASAASVPDDLRRQLKTGGRLVVPVQDDIVVLTKTSETDWRTETHTGYVFVPLIT